jgi:hypothetical protein
MVQPCFCLRNVLPKWKLLYPGFSCGTRGAESDGLITSFYLPGQPVHILHWLLTFILLLHRITCKSFEVLEVILLECFAFGVTCKEVKVLVVLH